MTDAPPLVVLHGLGGTGAEFGPTAAAFPDRRVLTPDALGHGDRPRHPPDVSRAAHVIDVVKLIESIGGPVDLAGQSMGGHTAMLVASERPDLVRRLVLLEAGVGGDGTEASRRGLRDYYVAHPGPYDPDVLVATIAAVDAEARWAEWERISAPTTVVFAEYGIFDEEMRNALVARGRQVVRRDLAGAGHDAHLDAPEEWVRVLREALA